MAERIIRRSLDEAEYMIYKLMRKDPNHVHLLNYPDQKKLKEAKMDIKKIFERQTTEPAYNRADYIHMQS